MGVIKRGILGGFSGSVANVVGSSWKGIAVIKSKPLSVANPKTAGQVNQRTKFSACSLFARNILASVVKPLWDRFAQRMSGYNAFIKENIDNFNTSGVAILPQLVFSVGSLTASEDFEVACSNGSTDAYCSWTDNSGTGTALATDDVYLVIIDAVTDEVMVSAADVTRDADHTTITMDTAAVTGESVYGYISFRSADGYKVSTSDTYHEVVP